MKQIAVVLWVCMAAAMVLFIAMGNFGSADEDVSKDAAYADSAYVDEAYADSVASDDYALDSCASVDDEYMY